MIKINFSIPADSVIALSGGVDSVAIASFLSKKRNVKCAFFHHNIPEDDLALEFVKQFCETHELQLSVGMLNEIRPAGISIEEHWRNCRYKFFDSLNTTVITGHNLDDCVETFLYSSLHGTPKVIPCSRNQVVRPFLTTPKSAFVDWCVRRNIKWFEDPTNSQVAHMRNYIRHQLMPHALHVNPGLFKTVKKIVDKKVQEYILSI